MCSRHEMVALIWTIIYASFLFSFDLLFEKKFLEATLSMYFKGLLWQLQFGKDVSKLDCKETKAKASLNLKSAISHFFCLGVVKFHTFKLFSIKASKNSNSIFTFDSVEFYNTHTEKWEMTDFRLSEAKFGFGFLTIKPGDILSKL